MVSIFNKIYNYTRTYEIDTNYTYIVDLLTMSLCKNDEVDTVNLYHDIDSESDHLNFYYVDVDDEQDRESHIYNTPSCYKTIVSSSSR